jgi:predicted transcriptional regulator
MLNLNVLHELMKEKNIHNLRVLAIEANMSYTTLRYMVTGHDMHVSTLVELSKFFNIPIDYLVNKSYGYVSYSDDETIYTSTTSAIEAAVGTMM